MSVGGNSTKHWGAKSEWFKKAKSKMSVEIRSRVIPETPLGRCNINITFGLPDYRTRDLDNMLSHCKPYIDALVQEKVIADDKWPVVSSIQVWGMKIDSMPYTIIEVIEGVDI